MRVRTARLLVAATVAATSLAGGCGDGGGGGDPPLERRIDLVVGDVLPLSGPDAGLGTSAQKAAQLAVEKINEAIGEGGVDHTLEIVHEDGAGAGRSAVRKLLRADARCMLGPWRIPALRRATRRRPGPPRALLIDPRAPLGAAGSGAVLISLPLADPTRVLEPGDAASGDDPSSAFARLYASTDPPIGPARAADARQFDGVILCYLAAVAAAGSDSALRMAAAVHPWEPAARVYSWPELDQAIEALGHGAPLAYLGVTLRARLDP